MPNRQCASDCLFRKAIKMDVATVVDNGFNVLSREQRDIVNLEGIAGRMDSAALDRTWFGFRIGIGHSIESYVDGWD